MFAFTKFALSRLFRTRRRGEEDGEPMPGRGEMGFLEHIEELRKVLFRCCLVFALAAGLSLVFYKDIFKALRWPLDKAIAMDAARQLATTPPPEPDPIAGQRVIEAILETGKIPAEALAGVAQAPGTAFIHMQVMKIMDVFTILMDVAMFGGLALAGPFILWFGAGFIAPALTPSEKRFITPVIIAALMLFATGAALSFFWLCPLSIDFALYLCREMNLAWNWTAADYYSFVVMMTLLVGLVFEFPLVIVALQYFEITSTRWLLSIWRQALLGILVVAVVFTPLGDPLSVTVLTGILFALYLVSIFVGDWLMRFKRRRLADTTYEV